MASDGGAPREGVPLPTLAQTFMRTAQRHGARMAIRTHSGDAATRLTWGELEAVARRLAAGLAALGVGRGDRVAIMLANRVELHLCDLATMLVGAASVAIAPAADPDELVGIAADAAVRLLVTDRAGLRRLDGARPRLPRLEHVIVVDGGADSPALSPADVEALGAGIDTAAMTAAIEPDDVLTISYGSGASGSLRGVEITHRSALAACAGLTAAHGLDGDGRVISWLPGAHLAERVAHHYLPIVHGWEITCCADAADLPATLRAVRPTWFYAVPRVWEKLQSHVVTLIEAQPPQRRAALLQTLEQSMWRVRLRARGAAVPSGLATELTGSDTAVFAGWRALLGLDQARAVSVGGAPTAVTLVEFFHAIGLPLSEAWGMRETCGVGTVNPAGDVRVGSAGRAIRGVEVRVAHGELHVRGDVLMKGYRNRPQLTGDRIDAEGWLHTGDLARIDDDGTVTILGRRSDVVVDAWGRDVSPVRVEAALKSASPLIGQVACIGDRRPYATALIVLDPDYAPTWAAARGLGNATLAALAASEPVLEAVRLAVQQGNATLPDAEQVRTFTVVGGDWLPAGGELTPAMTLRRDAIARKYAAAIEAMYAG
jgi:long-subunit acyl-CoA synthetase (AMP-forming)